MGCLGFSFSYYLVLLGILLSVTGTTLVCSQFWVWSFLVLGSLSVSCWLKSKVTTEAIILYFVVSVLGSLVFLVSCSELWFSCTLLQLSLMLKLGLAPFQFWVFKVLSPLDMSSLCFFLGPLKFGLL